MNVNTVRTPNMEKRFETDPIKNGQKHIITSSTVKQLGLINFFTRRNKNIRGAIRTKTNRTLVDVTLR